MDEKAKPFALQVATSNFQMEEGNQNFYCSITGELMVDPVIDTEGNSFERAAIEMWLRRHGTSPITRTPMTEADLRPNRALRNAIEEELAKKNVPVPGIVVSPISADTASSAASAINAATLSLSARLLTQEELSLCDEACEEMDECFVVCNATFQEVNRGSVPSDIVVVVDVSGSMGAEAKTQSVESSNLSLLDIVKHAVTTVIRTLGPRDRMALVSFSNSASVVLELTEMNEAGQQRAISQLSTLQPDGMTNLWDGLFRGLELLKNRHGGSERNSALLLLTDGEPNVEPPRGHIPMFKRYREANGGKFPGVINTFGFGYALDSVLLSSFAREGGGMYGFIPDAGFVGTAFVNALANILCTVARDVELRFEVGEGARIVPGGASLKYYPHTEAAWGVEVSMCNLELGQSQGAVFRVSIPRGGSISSFVKASLTYQSSVTGRVEHAEGSFFASLSAQSRRQEAQLVDWQIFRVQASQTIDQLLQFMSTNASPLAQDTVSRFLSTLQSWIARSSDLGPPSDGLSSEKVSFRVMVTDLMGDFKGQVSEAVSRTDWYRRWGRHYLPSLQRAHQMEQSNNFKDPGIQNYGGALFSAIRDRADDVFCQLPPPTSSLVQSPLYGRAMSRISPAGLASASSPRNATAPVAAAPISMSVFNNRDMPCFHENSEILLADNKTTAPVGSLKKGDKVCCKFDGSEDSLVGEVECVMRTACQGEASLVRLPGGLLVTPYHPVRWQREWIFPCQLATAQFVPCNAVVSLLLRSINEEITSKRPQIVVVDGIEALTLAHGLDASSVVQHDYFGTEKVAKDLQSCVGWGRGLVNFPMGAIQRSGDEQRVCGLKLSQEIYS